jgi:hypothetical protein
MGRKGYRREPERTTRGSGAPGTTGQPAGLDLTVAAPDLPAAHGLPIGWVMFRRPDFLIDEPARGAETIGDAARAAALLHDATSRHWDGSRWKERGSAPATDHAPEEDPRDDAHLRSVAEAVARFGARDEPVFKVTRPTVHAG